MKAFNSLMFVVIVLAALAVGAWASSDGEVEAKGRLDAVDVPALKVTVNGQIYSVSPNVEIEVEEQGHILFSQLPNYVGRIVELKLTTDNTVREIEVKLETRGRLDAVDVAGWTITVDGRIYSVTSSVEVKIEDQGHISFAQLADYIGRIVELKLSSSTTVYQIEVQWEATGRLDAVDVSGLKITVDGRVYSVRNNVEVEVEEEGRISFDQLPNYLGRSVEIKFDANKTIYKIEVKR